MTQIRLEAAHLGLNGRVDVRLANLSDRQKSLIYSASDILLFPSVDSNTAIEPPLTVLEALACALPVLAHDVCSANEVVLDGVNGCIMPFGSISADGIAEKAYEMLCDQKTIRRLSGNSRQIVVEKMSLAKSGERLARLYGDLATK
jgi:glycosyltransferase involved in cell wall biosynthesis